MEGTDRMVDDEAGVEERRVRAGHDVARDYVEFVVVFVWFLYEK